MAASKLATTFRAALNADEVEEACLKGVRASAEAGLLDDRISGEATDEPVSGDEARWPRDTQLIDDATGAVSGELARRANLPGKGYPFQFDGRSLTYVGSRSLTYEFCLAVARASTVVEGQFVRLPRNFERLCATAAQIYLGEGAESIRLGWPTDNEDPVGHPKDFRERAALLKSRSPLDSDEWEFAPKRQFADAVDNAKDHGMDFIAWKPFPDERLGRLTLLGQCACGRNDQTSEEKLKDLDLRKLGNFFATVTWLEPVRLFATPFHVPETRQLQQMHQLGGVVFDRARIAAICEPNANIAGLRILRPRLDQLVKMVLGDIRPSRGVRGRARGRASHRKRA